MADVKSDILPFVERKEDLEVLTPDGLIKLVGE